MRILRKSKKDKNDLSQKVEVQSYEEYIKQESVKAFINQRLELV